MVDRVRETEPRDNGPSQDLHDEVLAEFTELKTSAQRIAQKIKTVLGRYEAAGGISEEIKFSHKLGKLEKGEAQSLVRRLNRAARWSGVITWNEETGQSDFAATFDQPTEAAGAGPAPGSRLARARAYGDGYNSGKNGATKDANPFQHAPGSTEYVAWADGQTDGAADRAEHRATRPENAAEMQAEAQVDTSRKRPGRPPKARVDNGEDAPPLRGRRRRSAPDEDGLSGHA
jgi:ribosome modulation factor